MGKRCGNLEVLPNQSGAQTFKEAIIYHNKLMGFDVARILLDEKIIPQDNLMTFKVAMSHTHLSLETDLTRSIGKRYRALEILLNPIQNQTIIFHVSLMGFDIVT